MRCPRCERAAPFHGYRPRTPLGLCGPVPFQRAYYHCRACGEGLCPFDRRARLGRRDITPAVERLTTQAGVTADSFAEAVILLDDLADIGLSESTVRRVTEDSGERLAEQINLGTTYGMGTPEEFWEWHHDAFGRTVGYVSIDATGIRQQGPGGGKAEGRMAYVASIFNPNPTNEPLTKRQKEQARVRAGIQARYLSGLYELSEVGQLLRWQGASVGMERAEVWVGLTDGGSGLESFLRTNFNRPDLVVILDFYHAASYLEKLARALHPGDEGTAVSVASGWCGLLKSEGGAVVLSVLEQWPWPSRRGAALTETLEEVMGYFGNNVHRMEYPEYTANGWQIGSGVIESACKTVVGQRLKCAGQRWSEDGSHRVCHARALYRSEPGQWKAFWNRIVTVRTPVQQQL